MKWLNPPGSEAFPQDVQQKLDKASHQFQNPKYLNRLALEKSSYLLQHAQNPVNWYPWGSEAFETAKKLNRPILLSVGYSTCHWCHVMEEESFSDEEIGRFLNENYICIKVDREVRPDVDALYMSAVQAMSGQGGWPMNVWLDGERRPFFGGTYFPARDGDRGARIGFLTLLARLAQVYHEQKVEVAKSSAGVLDFIREKVNRPSADTTQSPLPALEKVFSPHLDAIDWKWGGLKSAPKFPSHLPARTFLRAGLESVHKEFTDSVFWTLECMARGGIYDQVGGGFHRYSTDEYWLVPHFEKMLYDNALLLAVYAEAYQVRKEPWIRTVVSDVIEFFKRYLLSPNGGFYSSIDADSKTEDGRLEEGWYYTWSFEELNREGVAQAYGAQEAGQYEGRNVLHVRKIGEWPARESLRKIRNTRPLPFCDKKIQTGWNALAITGLARAGFVFEEPTWIDLATEAAECILSSLSKEGELPRICDGKESTFPAFLEDYTFFVQALLDLQEVTMDPVWLERAKQFQNLTDLKYYDASEGTYFQVSRENSELPLQLKPYYDGAEPSGNSIALQNLIRLGEEQKASKLIQRVSELLKSNPFSYSEFWVGAEWLRLGTHEVQIRCPRSKKEELSKWIAPLRRKFIPYKSVSVVEVEDSEMKTITGLLCHSGSCGLPLDELKNWVEAIENL